MADALYDTTVLIDYLRGDSAAKDLVDPVIDGALIASYSPITVAELWQWRRIERQEEIRLQAILTFMEEAHLTAEGARRAGYWLRPLGYNQQAELFADALIAATAEQRNEPIYTRNVRDFRRFYVDVQGY